MFSQYNLINEEPKLRKISSRDFGFVSLIIIDRLKCQVGEIQLKKFWRMVFISFCIACLFGLFLLETTEAQTAFPDQWHDVLWTNKERLQEEPHCLLSHFNCAIAYTQLDEFDEAIFHFQEMGENYEIEKIRRGVQDLELELKPGMNLVSWVKSAFYYLMLQNYDQSIQAFQMAINLDPDNFWLYNFKGLAQMADIDSERAKDSLRTSLSIKNNQYTHAFLGFIFWSEGRYVRASWHFARTGTLYFSIRDVLN